MILYLSGHGKDSKTQQFNILEKNKTKDVDKYKTT